MQLHRQVFNVSTRSVLSWSWQKGHRSPGIPAAPWVEIPNSPASRSPFSSCPVSALLPAHRPGSQPGGVLVAAFELRMNIILLWLDIVSVTGILIPACPHAAEQSPAVGHDHNPLIHPAASEHWVDTATCPPDRLN